MAEPPPPLTPEQQADIALGRAVRELRQSGARMVVVTYDGEEPIVRSVGHGRRVTVAIPGNAITIATSS